MIGLFWVLAGGAAAYTTYNIASAMLEGNRDNEDDDSENKSDRNCYNCMYFDEDAWSNSTDDKDAGKYRLKVYCKYAGKEYSVNCRDDIYKIVCGKEYNHHYR